jgi:hypothetical protein
MVYLVERHLSSMAEPLETAGQRDTIVSHTPPVLVDRGRRARLSPHKRGRNATRLLASIPT